MASTNADYRTRHRAYAYVERVCRYRCQMGILEHVRTLRQPSQNTPVDMDLGRVEDALYAFGVRVFIDPWEHISVGVSYIIRLSDQISISRSVSSQIRRSRHLDT